jgi:hypothetical protein
MTARTTPFTVDSAAAEAAPWSHGAARVGRADHPGRWLGGAIGAAVALAAAAVAGVVATQAQQVDATWAWIALLGVPVAFVLGRQLFPLARSDGWFRALGVGLLLGWIAPPAGAIEIVYGLMTAASVQEPGITALWSVLLLPFALVVSFVAVAITLPAGIVWAVAVRFVPDRLVARLRVPDWLARFGARHLFALAGVAFVAAAVIGSVAGRS